MEGALFTVLAAPQGHQQSIYECVMVPLVACRISWKREWVTEIKSWSELLERHWLRRAPGQLSPVPAYAFRGRCRHGPAEVLAFSLPWPLQSLSVLPWGCSFRGNPGPLLAGPQLLLWSSRSLLSQDHHDCHGLQTSCIWSWYMMRSEGAAWRDWGLLEKGWWPLDRSMVCLSGTIPSPHGRIPGSLSLTGS